MQRTVFVGSHAFYYHSFLLACSLNLKFEAWIPQGALIEGYYSIVWSVTPEHCGNILFDELIFEAEVPSMKHKLWAKVTRDEIHYIRSTNTSNLLSLRLQQHLHIWDDSEVLTRLSGRIHTHSADVDATTPQESHFQAHYMKLTRLDSGTSHIDQDYEVKAPGQLLQRLDVMEQIIAMDVSAYGEYIAILSANQHSAYVGIWDMEAVLHPTTTGTTESNSLSGSNPRASISIPLSNGSHDIMRLARIAISSDGRHVVLYQQPRDNALALQEATSESPGSPFRYFRDKETLVHAKDFHITSTIHTTELIEDASIPSSKDYFVGYGKFMSRDTFRASSQISSGDTDGSDYFVACNESRIAVYVVDNGFQPLYGISIGELYSMKSRVSQVRMLHQSLQGPAFVWLEDLQHVSIWDIVSGTNLKYISIYNPHIQSQDEIEHIAVSPGGKHLALSGKNWIRTYFMDSGIEISSKVIHEGNVLNIEFLDHDKALLVAIGKPSKEQITLIMDAINLSSWNSTPKTFLSSSYSIQCVARLYGMTKGAQKTGGLMMGVNCNALDILAIPQPGVPTTGGPMVACEDDCASNDYQQLNKHTHHHPGSQLDYQLVVDFEEREASNRLYKIARVRLYSTDGHGQTQDVMTIIPEPWRKFNKYEDDTGVNVSFIDHWPQFIITTSFGFQVWNLPHISPDNRCEMAISWVKPCIEDGASSDELSGYAEKILETTVCAHGERVMSTWLDIRTNCVKSECIQIPKSNWISQTETLHCINSIPALASYCTESDTEAKEAIVRYIVKHINHDPPEGTIDNVMTRIARSAKLECCSNILDPMLRSTDGNWIPRCSSIDSGKQRTRVPDNPIMILIKDAKKDPQALPMAEQMMDYCIRQARSQCDLGFILPVMGCLRKLVVHHPELAIDIARRTALIPVKNREFLVNHSILARPIWRPIWDKIMRRSGAIYEYPNPAFQLRSQLPKVMARDISTHIEVSKELVVNPMNRTFKGQVYVAPYSLLLHYENELSMLQSSLEVSARPNHSKVIATLIRTTLNPWSGKAVRANFSDLDYFDNPAVEALIQYKWESIAWRIWSISRLFHLAYYGLIMIVAVLQIYPIVRIADLSAPLYAIMAMSLLFLHLEFKEFLAYYWAFITSPYNYIDMMMYSVTLAGSIQLLVNIKLYEDTEVLGNSRGISYSIIGVYLHLLFELRVLRSVCHITTIIWFIVYDVITVLLILMFGVVAVAATTTHMLWAHNHDCTFIDENGNSSSGPWSCPIRETGYPREALHAVFTTFFMMFGQYDALDKELEAGDSDVRFIILVYFVIAIVIIMNIVIAIMNHAMTKATYYAHLAWLSHLLRAAVSVETYSVSIREYREQVDLFPHEVYYAVPVSRTEEFRKKHQKLFDKDEDLSHSIQKKGSADIITHRGRDYGTPPCEDQVVALAFQRQEQHQQQHDQHQHQQQVQHDLQQLRLQMKEQQQQHQLQLEQQMQQQRLQMQEQLQQHQLQLEQQLQQQRLQLQEQYQEQQLELQQLIRQLLSPTREA